MTPRASRPTPVIVLADDEPTLRLLVGDYLVALGCRVRTAGDGHAALALADDAVDLALLDYRLPGLNGISVAHRWRAGGHRFPIILLTGMDRPLVATAIGSLGNLRLLQKPASLTALRQEIEWCLAEPWRDRRAS